MVFCLVYDLQTTFVSSLLSSLSLLFCLFLLCTPGLCLEQPDITVSSYKLTKADMRKENSVICCHILYYWAKGNFLSPLLAGPRFSRRQALSLSLDKEREPGIDVWASVSFLWRQFRRRVLVDECVTFEQRESNLENRARIAMDKNVDDVSPTSSASREDNEAGI